MLSKTLKTLLTIFSEDMDTGKESIKHTNHDKQLNVGNAIENSKESEYLPEGENYLLITEHAYTQVDDKNQVRNALNASVLAWR